MSLFFPVFGPFDIWSVIHFFLVFLWLFVLLLYSILNKVNKWTFLTFSLVNVFKSFMIMNLYDRIPTAFFRYSYIIVSLLHLNSLFHGGIHYSGMFSVDLQQDLNFFFWLTFGVSLVILTIAVFGHLCIIFISELGELNVCFLWIKVTVFVNGVWWPEEIIYLTASVKLKGVWYNL